MMERFKGGFPADQVIETEAVPAGRGISTLRDQYRAALLALMVLVLVVLLTTCSNVGNLLMLRNAVRARELAVRAALGAGRRRLALQCLVESTLLAAIGCAFGLLFARWGVSVIVGMLPLASVPDSLAFHADARTVGFAIAVSLAAALLFGLAPAWRATDLDLAGSLRASQTGTQPRHARRLGRALVACQVGFSVVLLVAAGLFGQTLRNLSRVDIGYSTDRLLQVSIDTRIAGYQQGQVGPAVRLLMDRVGAIPGVRSVTSLRNAVMRHSGTSMAVDLPGLQASRDEMWQGAMVGPSFFETLGIDLVRGRTFDASDFATDRRAYVINEAFARRYFPGDDPVARGIGIVGIVENVRFHGVREEIVPFMYEKMRTEPDRVNTVLVRIEGDARAVAPQIREAVLGVHPRLFTGIRSLGEDIERDIARERMVALISGFFSGLGLLLASIGIFGVASYTIACRTRELAIRLALGAGRWSVVREALRDTMVVFGIGLAAGTAAAVALVRVAAGLVADLLFGLTATDAANIAGAAAVMVAVAAAACLLPAHRVTTVDPLMGIREQ
jgi:predicted permease